MCIWTARPARYSGGLRPGEVGLDVPQATKIALALRRMGLNIDTAVYTVDELEQALLSIRGEAGVC